MTYFWETVDTIAPGLGWPHFGPFHLAVLAVFLLLGAVLCRGYCGMDTDKRRRWRRTVALLLVADELFKDFGLLYGGNFSLDYLPLHLCSINIFLIALHAWRRPKLLDTFLYFVCLPAACAALLFPTWAPLPHRRARRQIKPSADPARPAGAGRFICELSVSFHFPA